MIRLLSGKCVISLLAIQATVGMSIAAERPFTSTTWDCKLDSVKAMPAVRVDAAEFKVSKSDFPEHRDEKGKYSRFAHVQWSASLKGAFEGFEGELTGKGDWSANLSKDKKWSDQVVETKPFVERSFEVSETIYDKNFRSIGAQVYRNQYELDKLTGEPRVTHELNMTTGRDVNYFRISGLSNKEFPDNFSAEISVKENATSHRYRKIGTAQFKCSLKRLEVKPKSKD